MSSYLKAALYLNPSLKIAIVGPDEYANIDWGQETPIDEGTLTAAIPDALAQEALNTTRPAVVQSIKTEGLSRMAVHLPEMTDIDQLATIWRMTVASARSAAATTAKAIYDEAKAQIAWANDPSRTQAELDAYDPATNPAWPV